MGQGVARVGERAVPLWIRFVHRGLGISLYPQGGDNLWITRGASGEQVFGLWTTSGGEQVFACEAGLLASWLMFDN